MQKETVKSSFINSVTTVTKDGFHKIKNVNTKAVFAAAASLMLIAAPLLTVNSHLYYNVVQAEDTEPCFAIQCDGQIVARLKTAEAAASVMENYRARFGRDDAEIYNGYSIVETESLPSQISTPSRALEQVTDSNLFKVVYMDVTPEEVEIPYNTTTIEDETLLSGSVVCKQEGKSGSAIVKKIAFYENGVRKHDIEPIIDVVEQPCDEIIIKGTGEMTGLTKNSLPWPTDGTLTSKFGSRWGRNHNGIDIAASAGTPIYAPAAGVVTFSSTKNGYGNYIIIDHGNGFETTYAHMNERCVSQGASVKAGDLIGKVGTTGRVTGAHLHFEIKVNGKYVDPLSYIAG